MLDDFPVGILGGPGRICGRALLEREIERLVDVAGALTLKLM